MGAIITAVAALLIISVVIIVTINIINNTQNNPSPEAYSEIDEAIKLLTPVVCNAVPIGIIAANITMIGQSMFL